MTAPAPKPSGRPSGAADPVERPRPGKGVVVGAFAASLVLHAALVLLYPLVFGGRPAGSAPETVPEPRLRQGIEVVRIVETPEEELERPRPPEEPATPVTPAAPTPRVEVTSDADPGDPGDIPEPGGASAAERIRRTAPDWRLVAPLPDYLTRPSPELVAQLELIWMLEELNDSAAAAAARSSELTDWTFTDEQGRRWGLADGKIYLGDVALPFGFGAPYDPDAWKGSDLADLERALGAALAAESNEERAKAIRERIDRERKARADTTHGGR